MDLNEKMKDLVERLNRYAYQYYVLDEPTISDKQYDELYNQLLALESETGTVLPDSPTRKIGGEPIKEFLPHKHINKLYSLDKCNSYDELREWDKKIKKVSATERGTATHLFLQFCDFNSAIKNGLDHELSRLIEQKFIPENTAKLIFKDELERFFNSELITEILNAKEIIREQRFNILLPASEFTQNAEFSKKLARESLAVQGVIDLILIDKNGNICVYDYKTDRLSREELSSDKKASEKMNELHALQLSYYAKAVEAIFEAPCHKLCVYSTHAAKLFDINVAPLSIPDTLDTL